MWPAVWYICYNVCVEGEVLAGVTFNALSNGAKTAMCLCVKYASKSGRHFLEITKSQITAKNHETVEFDPVAQ